jgi:hypothetical protein
MTKDAWMSIRTYKIIKAKLRAANKATNKPVAQIVDEALNEKLVKLARKHPEIDKAKAA